LMTSCSSGLRAGSMAASGHGFIGASSERYDLARLYGVEVRGLNQAVKRNAARFPADFAFRLTAEEVVSLKSQSVISKERTHGGARRALPMAFTEQGVAMLSGVLSSPRAIAVHVAIMRAFVQMRRVLRSDGRRLRTVLNPRISMRTGPEPPISRRALHRVQRPGRARRRVSCGVKDGP